MVRTWDWDEKNKKEKIIKDFNDSNTKEDSIKSEFLKHFPRLCFQ